MNKIYVKQDGNGDFSFSLEDNGGIEISGEHHLSLIEGQSKGLSIITDSDGRPILSDVPQHAPYMKTQFTVREFRARFTQAEQIAIRQASMTDMEVGIVYDDFQAAQFIDLDDPAVAYGVDLYISKGLLETSRREALLAPESVVLNAA